MTHAQPQKKSLWNMNVDLMHGPIFKSLLLFMLPILVSNLFQQLYNTVDTMIVGNVLGDTALAAIGSCGSIYELLVGFGIGIGNGLSQHAGKALPVKDVVAQHQAHGVVPHKLLPDDKRLCQPVRTRLLRILETHPVIRSVPQQPPESG